IGFLFAARRPLLALSIMVVIEFTNLSGLFAERSGIPIFPASLLLGLTAVGFALRDPLYRRRINAWTVICAGLLSVYLATGAIATIGSVDIAESVAGMQRNVIDCVFVMVVLALVQVTARPWTVAAVIVVTLASVCMLTVISQVVYGGTVTFGGLSTVTTASGEMITTLRYGGTLPDSNFWGRHLALGLPMAAALMTRALRARRRATATAWGLAVVLLLCGVYLTQSRGSFLAAGVAIVVWFVAVEHSVRRWALILVPLGAAAFAVPGVGNRIVAAFEDFTQADVQNDIDPSVVQRLAAQEEAWMMFEERPYFGFGPATFPGQVINFAGRVVTAAREPTDAAHNLYAELAAESGWVGLLGWAVVILGFLAIVLLGIVANPRSRERILAAAVCAAIVAWSAASIGLQMAYFRTFGVVLALAGGLAPMWPVPAEAVRGLIRGTAAWCGAGLLGFAAFWIYLSANSSPVVTARQPMTLTPMGPVDGSYAYALDVRSRIELLPTFATVLEKPPVDVIADPVRGILTFTTTADNVDRARDDIQLAVAQASTNLHDAIGFQTYSLQTVGSMRIRESQQRSSIDLIVAIGIGAGTALITGTGLLRVANRRRIAGLLDRRTTREATSVSP
ncbi:MAG TPA: O-antigen ligase family protein, partial [Mycobacterium sp.]